MTIASGIKKIVSYKKESAFGTLPSSSGAQQIRRVTADFNLAKDTYESNEIRTDRQRVDMRHGVRSATGTISGELSPKTYSDFVASVVCKDFAAVTSVTGLSVTIAASGSNYTVTRSTGSYLTDGIKVGSVVRLAGAGLNVANAGVNLLVLSLTATVATVKTLNGAALVAEGPIASVTLSVPGKQTYVPSTGHTDDSYAVEQWFSDIAQSEVFGGLKPTSVAMSLPSTGLTTVDINFAGKDLVQSGTSQYFTSPTAQNSNGIFAAVNGALLLDGAVVALVTSANLTVEKNTENATAVGSNSVQDIFVGAVRVSGSLSVYFTDAVFRNKFDAETTASLVITLAGSNAAAADFMSIALPKVKFNSHDLNDAELGLSANVDFVALKNEVTTAGLIDSTILIQDSAA